MEWWSICHFGFYVPPSPESAKNCSRIRIQRAGSSDAPKLILHAFPLGGGQFNGALTRLAKLIAAMNSFELVL